MPADVWCLNTCRAVRQRRLRSPGVTPLLQRQKRLCEFNEIADVQILPRSELLCYPRRNVFRFLVSTGGYKENFLDALLASDTQLFFQVGDQYRLVLDFDGDDDVADSVHALYVSNLSRRFIRSVDFATPDAWLEEPGVLSNGLEQGC